MEVYSHIDCFFLKVSLRKKNPNLISFKVLYSLQAKQLAEFTATRKKLHWSHPSFVSFCGESRNCHM